MSIKAVLLFVATLAFISFAVARPIIFNADLTSVNTTKQYSGVAFAYITNKKGVQFFRARIAGRVNLTEDFKYARVITDDGWNLGSLTVDNSVNAFAGDISFNLSAMEYFAQDKVWVQIGLKSGASPVLAGNFQSGFNDGIAYLTGAAEVPATTSKFTGHAISRVGYPKLASWPADFDDSLAYATSNNLFNGRVVHDITKNVTAAHVHGSANASQTAGVLVTLTNYALSSTGFANVSTNSNFTNAIAFDNAYYNVHTAANANGEIRGQIFRTNRAKRRLNLVPKVNVTQGSWSGNWNSALISNTGRNALKSGTYVTFTPANGAFSAVLTYTLPIAAKEWYTIRGFFHEIQAQAVGNQTWNFHWLNYATNVYDFAGYFNNGVGLSYTFDWVEPDVAFNYYLTDFGAKTNIIQLKINSTGTNPFKLDLSQIRVSQPLKSAATQIKKWFQ